MEEEKADRTAQFLYEIGTLRKIPRMHRQAFYSNDDTDNIATHSFRVAFIGRFIAKEEGLNVDKVVMMCLLHDLGEARTGDHNWIAKRYVKIDDHQIMLDQLGTLFDDDLLEYAEEYSERKSDESLAAKDADIIDQILLIHEYAQAGNREAERWAKGDATQDRNLRQLKFESSKKIAEAIYSCPPYKWWKNVWTNVNK